MNTSKIFNAIFTGIILCGVFLAAVWLYRWVEEGRILRKVVERLSADSRIAEILVTKSELDESTGKVATTIKFLEYGADGSPLPPKYFTFKGNIIQFQSLVIRFEDRFIKAGDKLRGKSAYIFMKAFVLDGTNTQEFEITKTGSIPPGYRALDARTKFEEDLWSNFWDYALKPGVRAEEGIKNAQIEAPGSLFLPGTIYTIKIENDGGMRIDTRPVPEILKGEKVL